MYDQLKVDITCYYSFPDIMNYHTNIDDSYYSVRTSGINNNLPRLKHWVILVCYIDSYQFLFITLTKERDFIH